MDWQATTREQVEIRILSDIFAEKFDIVIAMDNALPHMLSSNDLEKPPYSPPYINKMDKGQRVSFQTWVWKDDNYKLTQYIIDDEENLQVSKFECEYRATRRAEMTELLHAYGCSNVEWKFPDETGFYQPIVVAGKA